MSLGHPVQRAGTGRSRRRRCTAHTTDAAWTHPWTAQPYLFQQVRVNLCEPDVVLLRHEAFAVHVHGIVELGAGADRVSSRFLNAHLFHGREDSRDHMLELLDLQLAILVAVVRVEHHTNLLVSVIWVQHHRHSCKKLLLLDGATAVLIKGVEEDVHELEVQAESAQTRAELFKAEVAIVVSVHRKEGFERILGDLLVGRLCWTRSAYLRRRHWSRRRG
mmetsp:Transcript_84699/g.169162  ORF Transcript_84699/g.169162 Transcript_84699/m.169162 type:complete len:219 (-) Transcript_84699:90-746(-)